jgi:hypothetical protein
MLPIKWHLALYFKQVCAPVQNKTRRKNADGLSHYLFQVNDETSTIEVCQDTRIQIAQTNPGKRSRY